MKTVQNFFEQFLLSSCSMSIFLIKFAIPRVSSTKSFAKFLLIHF